MKKAWVFAFALAAMPLGASCKGGDKTAEAGSAKDKGLADPTNDAAIVALAKPVLACTWGNSGFNAKCPALETWNKHEALKEGAGDKTLVNLLEDPDVKVQWLGAETLSRVGKLYRRDQALATEVVDAADKATDKLLVRSLARAVGAIDLHPVGLAPRVMKMLEGHQNAELRGGLAEGTLFSNREAPGMYDLFVKLARTDKDPKIRKSAAAAFWTGTPRGKSEQVCKLWLELANDSDADLAGHSAYHCAFTSLDGGCTAQWDGLLSLVERKAKAGQVKSSFMAASLKYFYGQKRASAAQKRRALDIAKVLVANTANDASSRSTALELVGKEDPTGKTFAARYENDKEFFVKSTAKRIKDGK